MNLRLPAPKAGALPGCATPRSERDPLACLFSRCKPLKRLGSYKAGKLEGQKAWRLGSMHALMLLDFSVIRLSSLPAFQPPSLPASQLTSAFPQKSHQSRCRWPRQRETEIADPPALSLRLHLSDFQFQLPQPAYRHLAERAVGFPER